jgi:hypothetical protein
MNGDLTLNPCAACRKKYDITDINNINQCCYNTLSAFTGATSLNQIRNTPEAQNCIKCVEESKKALGRDNCDFRLTAYPSWIQAPHYFPELLHQTKDVNIAKQQCIKDCQTNRYPNQCMDNCEMDASAVESYIPPQPPNKPIVYPMNPVQPNPVRPVQPRTQPKPVSPVQPRTQPKPACPVQPQNQSQNQPVYPVYPTLIESSTDETPPKDKPLDFYIMFIIILLILLPLLYIFLYTIFKK